MDLNSNNATDGETVHQVGEHPAFRFAPLNVLIWLHMTAMHHHKGRLHSSGDTAVCVSIEDRSVAGDVPPQDWLVVDERFKTLALLSPGANVLIVVRRNTVQRQPQAL